MLRMENLNYHSSWVGSCRPIRQVFPQGLSPLLRISSARAAFIPLFLPLCLVPVVLVRALEAWRCHASSCPSRSSNLVLGAPCFSWDLGDWPAWAVLLILPCHSVRVHMGPIMEVFHWRSISSLSSPEIHKTPKVPPLFPLHLYHLHIVVHY
jgi:hypothetical protein